MPHSSVMMGTVRTVLTALAVAVMAALTAISITTLSYYNHTTADGRTLILYTCILWALFALAFWLLRRVPARAVFAIVLVGSAALGGAAMAGPPNTSTDSARYAWDGIVQNAGISPYKFVPASKYLRDQRPDWLFPAPVMDASGNATCQGERIQEGHEPGTTVVVCTAMNRPQVPTIYPPSSELLFAGVRALVPADAQYWPMQAAGLLMDLGVVVILLVVLRRRGGDPRWAALFGWCPVVASEAVTNSHIDILGGLLLLVGTVLVSSGRRWAGGLAFGAAIAAKLIPVIGAPALLRRQPWKIVLASVAAFLLLYVPYILQSGVKVLGYLPTYLTEEGYDNGSRFALITPLVGAQAALPVAAALLVVLAVLVWRKTDPAHPWVGQVAMIGLTLLIVSPRYQWYSLLLLPMIAMSGRWEWLSVAAAFMARGLWPRPEVLQWGELIALVIVVSFSIRRAGPDWWPRLVRQLRHPFAAPAGDLAI